MFWHFLTLELENIPLSNFKLWKIILLYQLVVHDRNILNVLFIIIIIIIALNLVYFKSLESPLEYKIKLGGFVWVNGVEEIWALV